MLCKTHGEVWLYAFTANTDFIQKYTLSKFFIISNQVPSPIIFAGKFSKRHSKTQWIVTTCMHIFTKLTTFN